MLSRGNSRRTRLGKAPAEGSSGKDRFLLRIEEHTRGGSCLRPPSETRAPPRYASPLEVHMVPNTAAATTESSLHRLLVSRRDVILTGWVKEQLRDANQESQSASELR